MKILGIDPGTNIIGYGIVEKNKNSISPVSFSSIIIGQNFTLSKKLEIIFDGISSIISKFVPDEIAIEELFFSKNIKTAISVSHARGVIMLAAEKSNIPIFEYKPNEIKQAITGYGKAEKIQIQNMVRNILHLEEIPKPDDTADALAIALCHINKQKWNNLLKNYEKKHSN